MESGGSRPAVSSQFHGYDHRGRPWSEVDCSVEEWQVFVKASNGRSDFYIQTLLEASRQMLAEEMTEEETLLNQYRMLVVTRSTVR